MSIDKMTEGNCLSFRLLQAARELKKAEYIRGRREIIFKNFEIKSFKFI